MRLRHLATGLLVTLVAAPAAARAQVPIPPTARSQVVGSEPSCEQDFVGGSPPGHTEARCGVTGDGYVATAMSIVTPGQFGAVVTSTFFRGSTPPHISTNVNSQADGVFFQFLTITSGNIADIGRITAHSTVFIQHVEGGGDGPSNAAIAQLYLGTLRSDASADYAAIGDYTSTTRDLFASMTSAELDGRSVFWYMINAESHTDISNEADVNRGTFVSNENVLLHIYDAAGTDITDRYNIKYTDNTVTPEPATLALVLPGIAGVAGVRRRRRA